MLKLGKFLGAEVQIHWTFLLAAVLFFSVGGPVLGLFLLVSLPMCILAHEYGHVLMAQKFGEECESITLWALGGVALIKTSNTYDVKKEIYVAFAGPFVSFVLAGFFFALTLITGLQSCLFLAIINGVIGVFNLAPFHPMDGGRVLHAFLVWLRKNMDWADRWSKRTAILGGSFLFVASLLILAPMMMFIGAGIVLINLKFQPSGGRKLAADLEAA